MIAETEEMAFVQLVDSWKDQTHVPSNIYKSAMDLALTTYQFRSVNDKISRCMMNCIMMLRETHQREEEQCIEIRRLRRKIARLTSGEHYTSMRLRNGSVKRSRNGQVLS